MEQFWDQFRDNGAKKGSLPTVAEYNAALFGALKYAELSDAQAVKALMSAIEQQHAYELTGDSDIPNVPGKMYFKDKESENGF